MQVSPETVSITEWLNDSSLTEASRLNRRYLLAQFEKAYGSSIHAVLSDIKADKVTVYSVKRRFVDTLRKKHSPMTVTVNRSMIYGLFLATLGEDNIRKSVFNRL